MPRLFHRGEWFVELSPTALAEAEFESLLMQNSAIVRAASWIVPFKKTVYAGGESAKADLAIIAHDYREWVVVEVEMKRYDLHRHVIPQINTLRKGLYGQEHANYLASKSKDLDAAKISDMLRGEAPEVLVLVNKYDDEWGREIRRYGAHMMTFEIYRSEQSNRHIFAIDGELPPVSQDVLSELSFGLVPRCLSVKSPARLDFKPGEKVAILVDGQMTFWERFDTANQCFVTPIGTMPIEQGKKYALVRMENQQYAITTIN
ncbi:hypothetical protein JQK88_34345 [Mesorhizobium caraganae]|uniref:hypothetical protein n=1 Tax=Mesorhizobium caraganae TaxID=483206 RepID=UPI0019396EAB|nr:hypothetical protein [Mesorhizobium caraganae]MBM2716158.1 hypothetical protein [Mesorhizobium caraganae]